MPIVTVADLFTIHGRHDELVALLERTEAETRTQPGCRRYTFAATLADPDQLVHVAEWDSQAAMDAHYASEAFRRYQFDLQGLLARPSEMTIYTAAKAVDPQPSGPMDPRDAD